MKAFILAILVMAVAAMGQTISVQPASITSCVGASASFSVTASGTGTLHYQWERKHGSWSNVGTDVASYSWTAAAGDNGDSVRVTVTDDNSSILSDRACLTVTQLPVFTYVTNPATYTVDAAITENTITSTGGAIDSFTVSPQLPAGLSLNKTTGAITGTPTTPTP
jgi:hypothetical protein